MRAGKLRHRVTLQSPGRTQDPATGEMIAGWTDVTTVWASIEALSAREFIAAQAAQSEITARVVMRYRPGVEATMRLKHGADVYNIHGVLPDPDSGREWMTLPVSRGVNDGG